MLTLRWLPAAQEKQRNRRQNTGGQAGEARTQVEPAQQAVITQVEHEVRRGAWNVQRILLLAGLTWVSIGVSAFVVLSTLIAHGTPTGPEIPDGIQWIAMAPVGIGLAHLIVYAVGAKSER